MDRADALIGLQDRLGYRFSDPALLDQALTHRSWVEEQSPGGHAPAHQSQQRLEFLRDALLGYVVGHWLYDCLPHEGEGKLTERRSDFTRGAWLSAMGVSLGLEQVVRRGRGEAANDANRKLLEDTVEALIGAVLLDGGDDAALRLLRSWLPKELPPARPRDPIIAWNEWHQARFQRPPPEPYFTWTGPDNARTWYAVLGIEGGDYQGTGATKQEAKRDVCRQVLARLPASAPS